MEKDKSPSHEGGFPPTSARYSSFSSAPPSTFPPPAPVAPDSSRFSHDISRMSDFPAKNLGHRRAHSEILSLPDDISFDSELGVVGSADGPSLSDETDEDLFSMFMDMEKFNSSSATSLFQAGEPSSAAAAPSSENLAIGSNERPRGRHQHSQSMDGSISINPDLLESGMEGGSVVENKKAISAAKLADLALVDPKRAKRIWANRQSAARSKERKIRYISELERKVQTLQTEATTLSAQLTLMQRDTHGLNAENSELKLRLQTIEQQVHLQDALNDALREEVQRLKLMTGQSIPNGGPMMNFGSSSFGANQQFYPNNHAMQPLLTAHQFQQLQIQSQQPQQQQSHQLQQQQQQPHQLQLQQPHQLQHQQQQLQQQQQIGDLKIRGSLSSPTLEINPASKD